MTNIKVLLLPIAGVDGTGVDKKGVDKTSSRVDKPGTHPLVGICCKTTVQNKFQVPHHEN